jgi:hypothetical protein
VEDPSGVEDGGEDEGRAEVWGRILTDYSLGLGYILYGSEPSHLWGMFL